MLCHDPALESEYLSLSRGRQNRPNGCLNRCEECNSNSREGIVQADLLTAVGFHVLRYHCVGKLRVSVVLHTGRGYRGFIKRLIFGVLCLPQERPPISSGGHTFM